MKSIAELVNSIQAFGSIPSVTGSAFYTDFRFKGTKVECRRPNGNQVKIDLFELYEAYSKASFLNTIVLRKYISGRVFSPSLAILISARFYDKSGNRITK